MKCISYEHLYLFYVGFCAKAPICYRTTLHCVSRITAGRIDGNKGPIQRTNHAESITHVLAHHTTRSPCGALVSPRDQPVGWAEKHYAGTIDFTVVLVTTSTLKLRPEGAREHGETRAKHLFKQAPASGPSNVKRVTEARERRRDTLVLDRVRTASDTHSAYGGGLVN
jgi:hypothetical protein